MSSQKVLIIPLIDIELVFSLRSHKTLIEIGASFTPPSADELNNLRENLDRQWTPKHYFGNKRQHQSSHIYFSDGKPAVSQALYKIPIDRLSLEKRFCTRSIYISISILDYHYFYLQENI